jgi:hypothetical protein
VGCVHSLSGRSLSIKLIQQLRKQTANESGGGTAVMSASGARVLREISLETPIRYAAGDPVEAWLEGLLCLKAGDFVVPAFVTPALGMPALGWWRLHACFWLLVIVLHAWLPGGETVGVWAKAPPSRLGLFSNATQQPLERPYPLTTARWGGAVVLCRFVPPCAWPVCTNLPFLHRSNPMCQAKSDDCRCGLTLNIQASVPRAELSTCPVPKDCELYMVNRDTLFSCVHHISISLRGG